MHEANDTPIRSIFIHRSLRSDTKLSMGDAPGRWFDEVYGLIPSVHLQIYGVPADASEAVEDACDEGDYAKAIDLGELTGSLIMCSEMARLGNDPYTLCDDNAQDLEYVHSALSDEGGPLSEEDGDPDRNVLYIEELCIKEAFRSRGIGTLILRNLPALILKEMHVLPDVICYFPQMLEHEPEEIDHEAMEKYRHHMAFLAQRHGFDKSDNITYFPPQKPLTEKEINQILGCRQKDEEYKSEWRNIQLFNFYLKNGYREAGKSGLLYRIVDEDMALA